MECGHSELDSAVNELPDYKANESSKDHLHQAESYILNAREALENVIIELEDIAEKFDR